MSLAHFPQANKIYKNKSAKDVSLLTYFVFFVGCFFWVVYGIFLKEIPIIISFSIGLLGTSTVLFFILKYRVIKDK